MQERFNELKLKNDGTVGEASDFTSKIITTAFQNFADRRHCRRCLIFDCHMHEKYEPTIALAFQSEDKSSLFEDEDRQPCTEHCYLKGIKTCLEVYNYMCEHDQRTVSLDLNKPREKHKQVNKKVSRKSSRSVRKKSRLGKYARYPPALKKTTNGEAQFYKHYTPCTCASKCGDQSPCLTNENCCEKYCGYVI
ncbi:hypothetical protein ARALYDRAFT_887624 [Arabidopsis lyrata subsp. lyrata]|uniref:CXC domain-containing protein n=1 Tax=Arabidopsis lyrata subsp. lyrata TaxID=81972 RepID=D7KDG2_ARALL|nr:hypothetical protein ARALYDRAFT_887624 [Arabidopsis lyrata subsp. lyrata]